MIKSLSVSSENSLPPPDSDDLDSVCSDELMGSQSRHWLADLMASDMPSDSGELGSVGRDGLYVDYTFPVGDLEMKSGVRWKRPKELCMSPQFIVDGASRLDICQGKLSDCWVLSAIASVAIHPNLLKKVVPLTQSFEKDYNGSFTFRFWQYGEWEEVRVDDLLPTLGNKLVYLSSPERNEFWSSLLEKAYAKLKGGYRALEMGYPHEAMVDMTGGVTEVFNLPLVSVNLPELLRNLLAKGALINCANGKGPLEQKNQLGILFKHAYSMTAVERVKTSNGFVDLVRILNPWGNTEWTGPWSDINSGEWRTVSPEEQSRLNRVRREDGEFWMSVFDFQLNFDMVEVCHLTQALGEPDAGVKPWNCVMHHGDWVPNISNPQFLLDLTEVDFVPGNTTKTCSFIVALMQKYQRLRRIRVHLFLHIYPAHPKTTFLSSEDLLKIPPICYNHYASGREVIIHSSLPPGRYIIIPSTTKPYREEVLLAGSERYLSLEHCKSLVVLMDVSFRRKYTEPDLTISYPGFLYLLMKLETMIRKETSLRGEEGNNLKQQLQMGCLIWIS
uniref:Zgc:85932 n=1 Tax=Cyprinodon variegatus TaxID=28743 RepID=A0A3Q2EF94_CYPVA